jgi:1-aminocyclopropane-1-carboxylate deaminase
MIFPSIPLIAINDDAVKKSGVKLFVLRTDLNHPHISGNKLYKLRYNLQEAQLQNKKTLLTFGGAFSNHIAAVAAAGKEYNFETIGIIRGDKTEELNPTLKFASENGMIFHFVDRGLYRDKNALNEFVHKNFSNDQLFIIPEGGANEAGIKGCREISDAIKISFDRICCPCGTGTTLAGIILSLKEQQQALGFQVLKAENYIQKEVENWLRKIDSSVKNNWSVNEDFHFGGYAKYNAGLITFIKKFEQENNIPLDPVYTGKMFFGIYEMMEKGNFSKGETIIAIHTGGLQGNAGFSFR